MAILITGGGGFTGSRLADELVKRGERVVIFDIFLDDSLKIRLDPDRVSIVKGDISNWPEVMNVVRDHHVDSIFHLAAMLTVPSESNPWASIEVNAMGAFHVFEAARLFGAKKVLFTSSIASYSVDRDTVVTDRTAQRPATMYGITKVFAELLGLYYHRKFGIDFRGLRFPALLGPGVKTPGLGQYNPWAIEAAVKGEPFEIWAPEETVMPMIYVKDGIRGLLQLYDAPEEKLATRIYNSGQISPPPTARQLVDTIKLFYPQARITFKPDPALMPVLNSLPRLFACDEAQAEWGWRLSYSIEETVKDFIGEFKSISAD